LGFKVFVIHDGISSNFFFFVSNQFHQFLNVWRLQLHIVAQTQRERERERERGVFVVWFWYWEQQVVEGKGVSVISSKFYTLVPKGAFKKLQAFFSILGIFCPSWLVPT
jgi:hypothetical protein